VNREVNAALALPAVRTQIATLAADASPMTPAQLAAQMKSDSDRYGAIIRERKITES
jgi:tripartite-type tricarboxylate transporter receptor subunit TctC